MLSISRLKIIVGLGAAGALAVVAPAAATAAPTSSITRPAATTDGTDWSAASPAAAAALPSCPDSTLCTFQSAGYGGTRWNFAYSNRPHGTWFFAGSGTNDQISSLYNHREFVSDVSKNCPVNVDWEGIAGGQAISNLNDGHHAWPDGTNGNDSISGIALGTSTADQFPGGNC
jgi:hypothetical protein